MKRYDRVLGPCGFPVYSKSLVLLLVAIALLALLIGAARAEGQTMYVCTQCDPLNVRDAPSLHAPWVFRLDRGEAVTVHDTKDGWAYVERCGDYGWCWAEYLTDKPPVDKLPEEFLKVEME